jgi:threonine aldolase
MSERTARVIDLRSDTVTQPTAAMRAAMEAAEVGDDVYGEDPTINRLEAMTAEMLGKEAGLYVASGTMGNLIAVLSHCGRGDEMILGDRAHIFRAEQGGAAALGGVHPFIVPNQPDGTLDPDDVKAAMRADDPHNPITRLVCLENTQNFCGGRALDTAYMDAMGALAHDHGLKLHVDGARLWNAAVALNESPARVVAAADSVSVCLSKGLAAPVGSVVVGDGAFIAKARRMRKAVGGAMRQAGVLAAAGIVAITEMVERLADDHANARALAEGMAQIEGIEIDPSTVETNIVFFTLADTRLTPMQFAQALRAHGVRINASASRRLRAVLHYQVNATDVPVILDAFRAALAQGAPVGGEKVAVYG